MKSSGKQKDYSSSTFRSSINTSESLIDINLDLTYNQNKENYFDENSISFIDDYQNNENINNKSFATANKNKILTKKTNNKRLNFYFDSIQLNLLEKFFEYVESEKDLKMTLEIFEEIYEDHLENEELLFLCFWISFMNSKEIICEEILNKTKIKFFGGIEIITLENVTISSNELNNYAFNIAYRNNFSEKMLFYFLKKGKIKLPIEFIFKKLSENSLELIEIAWKADNTCFFSTHELKKIFVEIFQVEIENIISDRIIKAQLFAFIDENNKVDQLDPSNNKQRRKSKYVEEIQLKNNLVNLAVNLIKNADKNNDLGIDESKKKKINLKLEETKRKAENVNEIKKTVESEFLDLFVNNFGKLTISKILIIAHCLEEESNKQLATKEQELQQILDQEAKAEAAVKNKELEKTKKESNKKAKKLPKFLSGLKKKEVINDEINQSPNALIKQNTQSSLQLKQEILATSKQLKNYADLNRSICLFDKDKNYSFQILIGLFTCKNNKIAMDLLESNFIRVSTEVFKIALFFSDAKFSLLFYTLYSDFKIFSDDELHMQILEYLSEDPENLELHLFFIRMFENSFKLSEIKTLLKIIEELLQINNPNNKIIQFFANPIKIFVLTAEILNILKSRYPILDYNIQRLIDKCLDYSQNLQLLIEDDCLFREIILEKDLSNRTILDIISQNDFLILLENKLVEKIVDDLWNGPYSIDAGFFETSSNYKALLIKPSTRDYDIFTKQRNYRNLVYGEQSTKRTNRVKGGKNNKSKVLLDYQKKLNSKKLNNINNYNVNDNNANNITLGNETANLENNGFLTKKQKTNKNCCGLFNIDTKGDNTFNANLTNFKIWRNNIYLKYYIEILISLLLAVFIQFFSLYLITDYKLILNFGKTEEMNADYLMNTNFANGLSDLNFYKKLILSKSNFSIENYFFSNFNNTENFENKNNQDILNSIAQYNLTEYQILKNNKHLFYFDQTNQTFSTEEIKNLESLRFDFSKLIDLIELIDFDHEILKRCFYVFYFLIFDYGLRLIFYVKSKKPNFGLTLYLDIPLILIIFFFDRLFKTDSVTNFFNLMNFDSIKNSIINKINTNNTITTGSNKSFNGEYFFIVQFIQIINFFLSSDPYTNNFILYSIVCLILWLRIILLIRGTKTFGPIIVIFLISLKGIITYIVIFLLFNFFICCFGFLFFYNVDIYSNKNIFYTFFYYFQISLGGDPQFINYTDSSLQKNKPYIEYSSGTFIILIVLINSVIFVNLIIALLANIYDLYRTYSIQLFIQKKLEIRKKFYSEDKRFDGLLANLFPFSFLIFPLALIFLFIKDNKKAKQLNFFILLINFSFYVFFYLIYYILATLIFTPLAFVKILYSKLIQIFVNEIQQYFTIYKIFNVFIYLSFGIFVQLYAYLNDIILFFRELLYIKKDIPLINEEENFRKFNLKKSLVDLLIKIFKNNSNNINRISLENLLSIIIRCLDADFSESEVIVDLINYDLDDPKILKDYEENFGSFNIYNNKYSELFYRKGINYEEFLDFLSNFYDENYVVSVNVLINVLIVSKLSEKRNKYFKLVTDKNFSLNQSQKQNIFLEKVKKFYMENSTIMEIIKNDNDNINDINNNVKKTQKDKNFKKIKKENSQIITNKKTMQSIYLNSPLKQRKANASFKENRNQNNSFDFENSIFAKSTINNSNLKDKDQKENEKKKNLSIDLDGKNLKSVKNVKKPKSKFEVNLNELDLNDSALNVNTDLRIDLSPIRPLNARNNNKVNQPFNLSLMNSINSNKEKNNNKKFSKKENGNNNNLNDFGISLVKISEKEQELNDISEDYSISKIYNSKISEEKESKLNKKRGSNLKINNYKEKIINKNVNTINEETKALNTENQIDKDRDKVKKNDIISFLGKKNFPNQSIQEKENNNDNNINNKININSISKSSIMNIEEELINLDSERNLLDNEKEIDKANKSESALNDMNNKIKTPIKVSRDRRLTIIQENEEFVSSENNKNNNIIPINTKAKERRGTIMFKKLNNSKLRSFKTLFGKKFAENLKEFSQQENSNNNNNDDKTKTNQNINLNLDSNIESFENKKNKKPKSLKEIEKSIYLKIPIISRASLSIFINDLKEYQTDLSKKISESLAKNQKYLSDLSKSNNKLDNELGDVIEKEKEILKSKDQKIDELNKKIDAMKDEFHIFMGKTSFLIDKLTGLNDKYNNENDINVNNLNKKNENNKAVYLNLDNGVNNNNYNQNQFLTVKEKKDFNDYNLIGERKKMEQDEGFSNDSEKTLIHNMNENLNLNENYKLRNYLYEDKDESSKNVSNLV